MTDRRRGDRRPEEGSAEYEWLYGRPEHGDRRGRSTPPRGRRSPEPQDDETQAYPQVYERDDYPPDPTRVLPAQPPPRQPPPPMAPPPTSRPARERRPRRRLLRFGLIKWVLLAWLVFLVVVPFYAWAKVDKVQAFPKGDRPADQPGTTYLLVGSDSRDDLTPEERKELGTGGEVGQRTDTIMMLHTGAGPDLLMSIPRDSLVDIPDRGEDKINAAYAFDGPKLLVQTLENETGIRIDNYVEIGLGGFVNVVDAVGGIEICPTEAMKDPLANLDVEKGCQPADGKVALGFARSRHTSGLGDIDRARHQREVVAAVGDKALSPWSVLNPVRYWRLNNAMPSFFTVSDGTNPLNMGRFALAMRSSGGESGRTCGVPISDLAVNWDPERSQRLFDLIAADDTASVPDELCTPSGLPPGAGG